MYYFFFYHSEQRVWESTIFGWIRPYLFFFRGPIIVSWSWAAGGHHITRWWMCCVLQHPPLPPPPLLLLCLFMRFNAGISSACPINSVRFHKTINWIPYRSIPGSYNMAIFDFVQQDTIHALSNLQEIEHCWTKIKLLLLLLLLLLELYTPSSLGVGGRRRNCY